MIENMGTLKGGGGCSFYSRTTISLVTLGGGVVGGGSGGRGGGVLHIFSPLSFFLSLGEWYHNISLYIYIAYSILI